MEKYGNDKNDFLQTRLRQLDKYLSDMIANGCIQLSYMFGLQDGIHYSEYVYSYIS